VLRLASRGIERNRDPGTAAYWQFRLVKAETLLDLWKTKEGLALLQDPAPPTLSQFEARRLADRASAETGESQDLAKALRLHPDEEQTIRIRLLESILWYERHDLPQAEAQANAAMDLIAKWKDPWADYYRARALMALGHYKKQENKNSEAIELDQRALELARKIGAKRVQAQVLRNVGYVYAFFGKKKEGVESEQEAAEKFAAMGDLSNQLIAVGELGNILNMQGNSTEAVKKEEEAYYLAKRIGNRERDANRFAANAAMAYIDLKNWDRAERWNALADRSDPNVIWHAADIAEERGHPDKYFELCREAIGKATTPALQWQIHFDMAQGYTRFGNPKASFLEYEKALDVFEQARAAATDDQKISFLPRLINLFHAYVNDLIADHQEDKALQVIEKSRARVLAERFGASEAKQIRRPGKSSNTFFLSFWIAPKRSYVWLISDKAEQRFELPAEEQIVAAVEDYRNKILDLKDPLSPEFQNATVLWDMLLKQAAGHIPRRSRVVVIPDGPLHELNLETLVVPGTSPHYWLEDVEVVIAPSVALAPPNVGDQPKVAGPKVLLIGAPDYTNTKYPQLKYAKDELRDIQSKFPHPQPTLVDWRKATPEAYFASRPEQFEMIHFAAHADADAEKPLDSAVILSHGAGGEYKLYARDIYHNKVPIHANLVTVSACKSAGATFYAGEGLIGFAWVFLASGARNVIAGLWDVDDESSAALMTSLYGGIAQGQDPVTALHNAKLKLMKTESKPYYWAPLEIYAAAK
jgi:CHAT domain-containing protein